MEETVIGPRELRIGDFLLDKGEVVHATTLSFDVDDECEETIGFCKLGNAHNEHADWNRALYLDLKRKSRIVARRHYVRGTHMK